MIKKIILVSLSVIFFLASAAGIGWIVKKEIEKGKKEHEESVKHGPRDSGQSNSIESTEESISVSNKNEANKVLEDMDSIINAAGNENLSNL